MAHSWRLVVLQDRSALCPARQPQQGNTPAAQWDMLRAGRSVVATHCLLLSFSHHVRSRTLAQTCGIAPSDL